MAKKQLSDIEMMEIHRLAKEKAKHDDELKKMAKPSLLTRYFVAFIDFLFTAILSILLMTFLFPVYFNLTNYYTYQSSAVEYCRTTELFDEYDANTVIDKEYDAKVYDDVITHFYTTHEYGKLNNNYDNYLISKKESGLYELKDGNYVLVADYDETTLQSFLTNEYQKAISYAKTNKVYIEASNKTLTIFAFGVGVVLLFTTSLFYLLIPLIKDEGETLGQMIFKLCLIDTNRLQKVKKGQIVLRFFFCCSFHYYVPAAIMLLGGSYVMLLPILISAFIIGFDKNYRSIHCFLSNTMVICKHRTNAEKMLQSIASTDETRMY